MFSVTVFGTVLVSGSYRCTALATYTTVTTTLDDQTQVNLKPAGQPEHASLNQCQLIAANRPKIGALGTPADVGGDKVSQ